MQRLHQATEETVYLVVRRGDERVCIEQIDGLWIRLMVFTLGVSLPLHIGAATRALLAAEPPAFWDAYLASRSRR